MAVSSTAPDRACWGTNVAPLSSGRTQQPRPRCSGCGVRGRSICGGVEAPNLMALDSVADRLWYPPGAVLIHQGELPRHVFSIRSGTIRIVQMLPDGRRQLAAFLVSGDTFGLGGLNKASFSAEAVEASEVCRLTRVDWIDLSARSPGLSQAFIDRALMDLERGRRQMLVLGRKTAVERLASFLLERLERETLPGPGDVRLPMARGEIADYLGLTIETVSRVLTGLKRTGVVSWSETCRLTILKKQRLRFLSGDL